jgi:hypothetical protein
MMQPLTVYPNPAPHLQQVLDLLDRLAQAPDFSRDLENLTSISLSYKEEPLRWAALPT